MNNLQERYFQAGVESPAGGECGAGNSSQAAFFPQIPLVVQPQFHCSGDTAPIGGTQHDSVRIQKVTTLGVLQLLYPGFGQPRALHAIGRRLGQTFYGPAFSVIEYQDVNRHWLINKFYPQLGLASQKLGQANGAKYSSREEGAHLEDHSEHGIIRELAAGIGAEIGCWPEPTGYLVQHMAGPLHI